MQCRVSGPIRLTSLLESGHVQLVLDGLAIVHDLESIARHGCCPGNGVVQAVLLQKHRTIQRQHMSFRSFGHGREHARPGPGAYREWFRDVDGVDGAPHHEDAELHADTMRQFSPGKTTFRDCHNHLQWKQEQSAHC